MCHQPGWEGSNQDSGQSGMSTAAALLGPALAHHHLARLRLWCCGPLSASCRALEGAHHHAAAKQSMAEGPATGGRHGSGCLLGFSTATGVQGPWWQLLGYLCNLVLPDLGERLWRTSEVLSDRGPCGSFVLSFCPRCPPLRLRQGHCAPTPHPLAAKSLRVTFMHTHYVRLLLAMHLQPTAAAGLLPPRRSNYYTSMTQMG